MEFAMADPVFQQAFETVRKSCSTEVWDMLSARQITELVYQEMRRIDARLSGPAEPPGSTTAADDS
jgi:hypothetical protein